jgi:hypothetical protein
MSRVLAAWPAACARARSVACGISFGQPTRLTHFFGLYGLLSHFNRAAHAKKWRVPASRPFT